MSYSKVLVSQRLYVWSDRHHGGPPPRHSRSAVLVAHGCQVDGARLAPYASLAARYPERFTTPPQTQLVFYCADGQDLENTIEERQGRFETKTNCNSLIAVASNQAQPKEIIKGNQGVRNYFLSKNNGWATNFSYEIIRHYMHPAYRRDMVAAQQANGEAEPYLYQEYLERVTPHAPRKPFYHPWKKAEHGAFWVVKEPVKDCVFPMEADYFHEIVSDVITLVAPEELPSLEEYEFLPLTLRDVVSLLQQQGYFYHTIHCFFCRSSEENHAVVPLTRRTRSSTEHQRPRRLWARRRRRPGPL